MKEIAVTAAFGATDDAAIERLRQVLPGSPKIRSDGNTVKVQALYDDSEHGPGDLPEGAFVAMRQVLEAGDIAGLGSARAYALTVRETG